MSANSNRFLSIEHSEDNARDVKSKAEALPYIYIALCVFKAYVEYSPYRTQDFPDLDQQFTQEPLEVAEPM